MVINDAGIELVSTTVYISPYFIIETAEDIFVHISAPISLICEAKSFPCPKYQWFKLMSENFEKLEGENTTTFEILSVDFSDSGTYQCDVTTDLINMTITKFFILTSKFKCYMYKYIKFKKIDTC